MVKKDCRNKKFIKFTLKLVEDYELGEKLIKSLKSRLKRLEELLAQQKATLAPPAGKEKICENSCSESKPFNTFIHSNSRLINSSNKPMVSTVREKSGNHSFNADSNPPPLFLSYRFIQGNPFKNLFGKTSDDRVNSSMLNFSSIPPKTHKNSHGENSMQLECDNSNRFGDSKGSSNRVETFSDIFGRSEPHSKSNSQKAHVETLEIKTVDVKKERLLQRGLRSLYSNFDRSAPKIRDSESRRSNYGELSSLRLNLERMSTNYTSSLRSSSIEEKLKMLRQNSTYTSRLRKESSFEIEEPKVQKQQVEYTIPET